MNAPREAKAGERNVTVSLETSDGESRTAQGVLREFSVVDRAKRAAAAFGISVLLAAMFIPIPIIHLLAIPFILIGGIAVTGRQLLSVARLQPMRIECPKCGAPNRVGGGLGYRRVDQPFERICEECRRKLQLRILDA